MTKRFCDICEAPAKEIKNTECGQPYGKSREGEDGEPIRTQATVHLRFGLRYHPTGFGGPPDLCPACALKLLDQLREQIRKEVEG